MKRCESSPDCVLVCDFGHGLKLTDHEQEHEHDYDLRSIFPLVLVIVINSYLSWRPHDREHVRLFLKIFRGGALYIFQRDRLHLALERLVIGEAEPVKLIERRHVAEGIVALIGDLLLPEQFLSSRAPARRWSGLPRRAC